MAASVTSREWAYILAKCASPATDISAVGKGSVARQVTKPSDAKDELLRSLSGGERSELLALLTRIIDDRNAIDETRTRSTKGAAENRQA